ncbi:MAG: hypothetical protein J1G06_09825 [Oscillospiraceae bacterium]|nr:hypothetical protein [Oscillospiraceae bacterium]
MEVKEKIYCIKCGREIKEGLLYCDRCGQSVAKSKAQQSKSKSKRRQAEQIHREQINRRKRREEKEIKKQAKRRKARRSAAVICVIIGIILLGVLCAAGGYIYMSGSSSIKSIDDVVNEDIAQSSPVVANGRETTGSASSDTGMSFKLYEYGGLACPYPESFTQKSTSGGELLRLEDAAGGAVMTLTQESVPPADDMLAAADELMTAYYRDALALGSVTKTRLGAGWYIITYETDTRIFHRKCVISSDGSNTALRYDFEYDKSSAKAEEYANCIASLDENFISGQDSQ